MVGGQGRGEAEFCCQAEDKFKSSTGHCHSLSLVNLEIGKVFSLNSQENLQLRISPVVSSTEEG